MASKGNSLENSRDLQDNLPEVETNGVSPPTLEGEDYNTVNSSIARPPDCQSFLHSNFYEDEYNRLVSNMHKEEVTRSDKPMKPFQELLQLSVLADEHSLAGRPWELQRPSRVNINRLLKCKRYLDKKHGVFMSCIRLLEQKDLELTRYNCTRWRKSVIDAMEARLGINDLLGCGLQKEKQTTKMRLSDDGEPKDMILCRHFTKGYCKLGEACSFSHSVRISHPDSQKLFLGGLPKNITSETLVFELSKKGYTIINEPKIFHRFCPQVCLGSVEEAQKMLREGKISILGCSVDVRPYKARKHKNMDRQLNVNNRSVFLDGVSLPQNRIGENGY